MNQHPTTFAKRQSSWNTIGVLLASILIMVGASIAPGQELDSENRILLNSEEDPSSIDAGILALELSGEPLPPQDLYEQLYHDLVAIRESYPCMSSIRHHGPWVPRQILVKLTDIAWEQYQNGVYTGLDSLNAQYGAISVDSFTSTSLKIDFAQMYNPEFLSSEYSNADGVESASPNHYIGLSPLSRIKVTLPEYIFTNGYLDNIGLGYTHSWNFTVSDSQVVFLGQSGPDVPTDECSIYLTNLPVVLNNYCSRFAGPTEREPNDNFTQANGCLSSGVVYSGHPDDDFYFIYLHTAGTITVDVTNFSPEGQIILYGPNINPNDPPRKDDEPDGHYQLSYGGIPGLYYIRVVSVSDHEEGNGDYALQVTFPTE